MKNENSYSKMKKYVFLLSAAFSFLCANGIDTESVKVEFEGYKTSEMVGTKGVFKTGKFMFGKDNLYCYKWYI